jgi:hypothetical protein
MLHRQIHARVGVPPGEATLPPLGHAPEWAEPIKTRSGGFRDGHWVGFLFLVPFVVMFVLHEPLGMTDAFLMGDQGSANYNLMTFATLFLGSSAFVIYAFALPIAKGRGWRWVMPKIIFLVVLWGVAILVMRFTSLLHPVTPDLWITVYG